MSLKIKNLPFCALEIGFDKSKGFLVSSLGLQEDGSNDFLRISEIGLSEKIFDLFVAAHPSGNFGAKDFCFRRIFSYKEKWLLTIFAKCKKALDGRARKKVIVRNNEVLPHRS